MHGSALHPGMGENEPKQPTTNTEQQKPTLNEGNARPLNQSYAVGLSPNSMLRGFLCE